MTRVKCLTWYNILQKFSYFLFHISSYDNMTICAEDDVGIINVTMTKIIRGC